MKSVEPGSCGGDSLTVDGFRHSVFGLGCRDGIKANYDTVSDFELHFCALT